MLSKRRYNCSLLPEISCLRSLQLCLVVAGLLLGCQTPEQAIRNGVQHAYKGFIPARIAVVEAREWPIAARFKGQTPINIKSEEIDEILKNFDDVVLASFSNQPFMKGFTPKYIRRLLTKNKKDHLLSEISQVWRLENRDCRDCDSPIKTYNRLIASKTDWRLWLNSFSTEARYADALLLPLLVSAYEHQFDDRGLLVSKRTLELVVLLIDTNNGSLEWIGHRKASLVNDKIRGTEKIFPPYPEWAHLYKRIFTLDLWRQFPGMQQIK